MQVGSCMVGPIVLEGKQADAKLHVAEVGSHQYDVDIPQAPASTMSC